MSAIRRLKRNVAKVNMKRAGMKQVCKRASNSALSNRFGYTISDFSVYWRDFVKAR